MLARRFLQERKIVNLRCSYMLTRWSHQAAEDEAQRNFVEYFTRHAKKQPQRKPFAKNLFMGKVDVEFLPFPEPEEYHRYDEFKEWLKSVEEYISMCVERGNVNISNKQEILSQLRELGVFRAVISENYQGLRFSESETARLVETVSAIPWLGIYFVQNYIVPTQLIMKYGSEAVKQKYLHKIGTGEIVPTVCSSESIGGTNVLHMKTTTKLKPDQNWLVTGEKSFVFNAADSNLFVVIAHCPYSNEYSAKNDLCMLIIERGFNGIGYGSDEYVVGHKDTSLSTVSFNDTLVPAENVLLGSDTIDILKDILSPGKQNMAGVAIGILRSFIGQLTINVLQRKHLDKNLHEFDYMKATIGKLTASLYCMESALYWTVGMADTFMDQDLQLERAITETYCANECVKSIQTGLHIIGMQSYLRKYPYIEALENALLFSTFCTYNMDAKVYIGLLGLQHTGRTMHDTIFKNRNLFKFPYDLFKAAFSFGKDEILYISDNLHPSFKSSGDDLEKCIHQLKLATVNLFTAHGTQVIDQHLDLCKLSDMAVQIYVALACLSRASRSYCIGIKNSNSEKLLSQVIAKKIHEDVMQLSKNLNDGVDGNGDAVYKHMADETYKIKGYFIDSALSRVI